LKTIKGSARGGGNEIISFATARALALKKKRPAGVLGRHVREARRYARSFWRKRDMMMTRALRMSAHFFYFSFLRPMKAKAGARTRNFYQVDEGVDRASSAPCVALV
jgi:hypothetical protein